MPGINSVPPDVTCTHGGGRAVAPVHDAEEWRTLRDRGWRRGLDTSQSRSRRCGTVDTQILIDFQPSCLLLYAEARCRRQSQQTNIQTELIITLDTVRGGWQEWCRS